MASETEPTTPEDKAAPPTETTPESAPDAGAAVEVAAEAAGVKRASAFVGSSGALTQWLVSLVVNGSILLVLAYFTVEHKAPRKMVKVDSELTEETEAPDIPEELLRDEEIDMDAAVSLTGTGAMSELATPAPEAPVFESREVSQAMAREGVSRPLSGGVSGMNLDSNVTGLKGSMGMAVGGDAGTVDRIVKEVIRELNKRKVVVAWLFDASGSLEERRDDIATRFDRIYKELEELGVSEEDEAVLTVVAAVGEKTTFVTPKPTADTAEIRKAIRKIKDMDDGTGVENLLAAARETALKFRRFQTSGRRALMVVLVTDEVGDDLDQADATVTLLKRNNVPMYVMGPMAHFGREDYHERWIDPETKNHFWIPIKKGPYTRMPEVLRVPFQHSHYPSGFGAFQLTQMARETGGMYFIFHDDERLSTKKFPFDHDVLLRYVPNYGTVDDYGMRSSSRGSVRN